MLLDDVYAIGHERWLTALDAHPNVTVKLFNGTQWRRFGRWGYALEIAFGGWHLNRRMHNKNWIADGRLAVVGGRNIGNEYFGLDADGAVSFRDLDLVLAGAPAKGAVKVFERYWASPLARPAALLSAAAEERRGGLVALRRDLAEARRAPEGARPARRAARASAAPHPPRPDAGRRGRGAGDRRPARQGEAGPGRAQAGARGRRHRGRRRRCAAHRAARGAADLALFRAGARRRRAAARADRAAASRSAW